jgi:alpha-beta hydrolase superfamily lysophospholipase
MEHPAPAPPSLGTHDGLAYALFMPDEEPSGGVVVLHGAGSAKENHYDFARVARAHGLAAIAYDARGHGRSEGEFGPSAFHDAAAMCDLLREHVPGVALRGSSMGGFCAIHAAALDGGVAAVAAICPATAQLLLRGVRAERLTEFRMDRAAVEPWLESLDTVEAAASLAPETALLLMHAEGDEQVPYTISQELYERAGRPKRLLLMPGGHHRSLQHDAELQGETVRFLEKAIRGA